jgi:hypothetical protein
MEPEPFYDDDGDQVGWVVVAGDGNTYVTELDGVTVAGVWDDEGQGWDVDIEPLELTYDEGEDEDAYDEQVAGFDDRLAALEQQSYDPRPAEVVVTAATEQADVERWNVDMARQREHLEAMLGRPLLLDEARRLGQAMLDDLEAGSARPDIIHSAEISGGLLDLDGGTKAEQREARRDWMTERFRDLERQGAAERGEDNLLNEQPPPTQDNYDLDDA